MPRVLQGLGWLSAIGGILLSASTWAQNASHGAMLYMRMAADVRSCVSCHGPDPGLSHNNILRAADNPAALSQVLNTVSAMGFLRPHLSDADRADVTAFLGTVVRLNAPERSLRMWPITMEFGGVPPGGTSAPHIIRISNVSTMQSLELQGIAASSSEFAVSHDCPATLAPGGACDAQVRLKPGAIVGLVRGAVQVTVGGGAAGAAHYAGASGYGVTGPLSQLEWRPGDTVARFTAPAADGLQRKTLVLANPGPMPAVLAATSITGPRAAQYRVESDCAPGTVLVAGTQCEMVVAYTAGPLASAQAVLQVRSDQGNPASVRLEGVGLTAEPPPAPPPPPVMPEGGGGCSVGPPSARQHVDPVLLMAALLAGLAALARRPRR